MRYAPTAGYVRPFEKLSRFRPLRGRLWGVFNTPLQLGTCEGSKNGSVYATVGGVWWGVCDTPLQPSTCGPPKNYPVFVSFGAACGAYAIRPYNRIRVILRNTDAIFQLDTCGPSKNYPVFVPYGAAGLGVFDTPLQPGTCDSSEYRCNFPTGYVWHFKKLSRFRPLRGRLWGVFNTPHRPGTCAYSKYRCDPPIGYVRSFGIPMRSLDRRDRGVWEVGRWGLPFAGETGVNEFGKEEDDDQNNDNKGA